MDSLIIAALALALTNNALAQGAGPGKGMRWQFGASNTSGWGLMSEVERVEHRNKMMSFQTYAECRTYVEEHHKLMQARALECGQKLPDTPRGNICERMQRAGRLK